MKKIAKILAMFAVFAVAFSFAGCKSDDSDSSDDDVTISGGSESGNTGGSSSGSIEQIPEVFVKIPAASIAGTETWTPESEVFISGRKLEIASFYMSDHPVTRGEYKAVMGSDPSEAKAYDKAGNELKGDDAKNNPVNTISWYGALVYCNTRSIKEKLTPCYSINGSTNPDDWGSVPTSSNCSWDAAICDFTANGYGLYDMSGNVWEWCWDWYGSISSDTAAAGSASGWARCYRGGSWFNDADYAQVANQSGYYPYYWYNGGYGFRLVRTAK